MSPFDPNEFERVVQELRALPLETTWAEFKHNNAEPKEIGEYISALANAAALDGKGRAYMLWGIDDESHDIVGTTFDPERKKGAGGEELVPWLTRLLSPQINFTFQSETVDGHAIVLLEIDAASHRPVQFQGTEFIRVGSYKKKLKDHPEHERRLWKSFDSRAFEVLTALDRLTMDQVLEDLDYASFFRLSGRKIPESDSAIIEALDQAELVRWDVAGQWSITNLGAILIANDLSRFPGLARKAVRVIHYRGDARIETLREQVGAYGYASGFEGLFRFIMNLLPHTEVIDQAFRRDVSLYPPLAIRELVANMLVHQDLSLPGSGPTVEIFENRIEITNPGAPLIDKARFIDSAPLSRNEKLARAMRQMYICEERGSGWDKVAFEVELNQLPAPLIETTDAYTRVIVYGPMPLNKMQRDDRARAVYLHACLRYVSHQQTTNSSIRERFGIAKNNAATASRLIREGVEEGLIRPYDPKAGRRAMSYVPFWV